MDTQPEKFRKLPLFNPLDKKSLGKNVADQLLAQELQPLPPLPFYGAGIYALYYHGDFPHYQTHQNSELKPPIYVGKAIPEGGRKGVSTASPEYTTALYKRLKEHATTIGQASNLSLDHFSCRFLVVDDIWIPLAESMLIATYAPIWNVMIEGFGIHAPGGGREGQKKSVWDTLHPGRAFANKLQDNPKAFQIIEKLASND